MGDPFLHRFNLSRENFFPQDDIQRSTTSIYPAKASFGGTSGFAACIPPLWDGKTAERIVETFCSLASPQAV